MNRSFKESFSQTPVTYVLLMVIGLAYVGMLWKFGTTQDAEALYLSGANFTPAIVLDHEWWRLLSAGFLHIGFQHLVLNGLSLYYLGADLERMLGSWRFLIVYLTAVIGGNLVSFAMNPEALSAGASTGIYGLFVSFIVLSQLLPESYYLQQLARSYGLLIVLNIFSFVFPSGTDHWGHLGGALYGGAAVYALVNFVQKDFKNAFMSVILVILLSVGLIYRGCSFFG